MLTSVNVILHSKFWVRNADDAIKMHQQADLHFSANLQWGYLCEAPICLSGHLEPLFARHMNMGMCDKYPSMCMTWLNDQRKLTQSLFRLPKLVRSFLSDNIGDSREAVLFPPFTDTGAVARLSMADIKDLSERKRWRLEACHLHRDGPPLLWRAHSPGWHKSGLLLAKPSGSCSLPSEDLLPRRSEPDQSSCEHSTMSREQQCCPREG